MPGVQSLEAGQYYAHPRNAFWPIMQSLAGIAGSLSYADRCQMLMDRSIALWDVLQGCIRPGSLDVHIQEDSIVSNDLGDFLTRHSSIQKIGFNGRKAAALYRKHVFPRLSSELQKMSTVQLPSTSPAHASLNREEKLHSWKILLQAG